LYAFASSNRRFISPKALLVAAIFAPLVLAACGVTGQRNNTSTSGSTSSAALQISTTALPSATVGTPYSSQLSASGGTAPYSWSASTKSLPPGVTLNSASGILSGSPSTAGSYNVSVSLQDSSNPPVVVAKTLAVHVNSSTSSSNGGGSSGSGSGTSSGGGGSTGSGDSASGIYGSGINADALNNITIGPHVVSYRFLSTHGGTVSKVHFYLIVDGSHAGYNSGTGGTLKIQLETDDGTTNHGPSGTVLGTYTIPQPNNPFPVISFSPAPTLKAGELYHLVFSNTDPNPNENFVSVDDLWMASPRNPMQPAFSNENLATLLQDGSNSWGVYDYNTPIYEIDFSDGASIGQGYMEVWSGTPEPISGSESVRETFTVSGSEQMVSNVSIRLAHISGSGALTVRLEQGDGNLVEQGTISASSIPISSSGDCVWATYTFSALRTLLQGQQYNLVLQAPSGTLYQAFPIRKGSAQDFQSTTFFPDGYAQFNPGGNWVGWTQWGVSNRTDGDLQFYFTEVN
jgi:Putative Ig domain